MVKARAMWMAKGVMMGCALVLAGCDVEQGASLANVNGDASSQGATGRDQATGGNDRSAAAGVDSTGGPSASTLADRLFTFGDSSFFSSGSVTENNELQLCAFGRFAMRVTQITSTSFDTFSSERLMIGDWSVAAAGGGALTLTLSVDNASDPSDLGERRIVVRIDASGRVSFDGVRADVVDAAADCALAQQG
ncbi:MAG TPA: hypothetical protein P5081_11050 [Phycisphaerae bacterium]|nr:hypothetical protein [Phycisphaerae bacterium]HRW53417.1 hypothetical protein [Phycisphaerae bacterium]